MRKYLGLLSFNKITYLLLIILILFSPLVYTTHTDNMLRFPKEVFAQILIVIILTVRLIMIIEGSFNRKRLTKGIIGSNVIHYNYSKALSPNIILLSLFAIGSLLSLINSPSIAVSIKSIHNLFLYILLYISILSLNNIITEENIVHIMYFILIPATISSLYSIIQYFGLDLIFYPKNPADKGGSITVGFLDNPNLLAGYLAMVFPISLSIMVGCKSKIVKAITGISICVLLTSIKLTGNRTSLACLIASSLFFFIYT